MRGDQFCEFLTQSKKTEFKGELQLGELRGRFVLGEYHGFIRLVRESYERIEDDDIARRNLGKDKCSSMTVR